MSNALQSLGLYKLAKKAAPERLRRRYADHKEVRAVRRLLDEWRAVRPEEQAPLRAGSRRAIVITADAKTLIGGRGDQAMLSAVSAALRKDTAIDELLVMTETVDMAPVARDLGLTPLMEWNRRDFAMEFQKVLDAVEPAAVVAVGADVLDGVYGIYTPAKTLIALDLAARHGAVSLATGCSFNRSPSAELRAFFDELKGVHLNLRDPVSLRRFNQFSSTDAELTADIAFLIPGDMAIADTSTLEWVNARRQAGDMLVGLNIHPMLFKHPTPDDLDRFIQKMADAVAEVSRTRRISWVLIPHDFREGDGDYVCLQPLLERLNAKGNVNVRYLDGDKMTAEQLKGMASLMDGVVSARMHLAIASLGSSVPVMGIVYQDKFEGLFEHFGVSTDYLVQPAATQDVISRKLAEFLSNVGPIREHVAAALPRVLEAAERNFAGMAPLRSGAVAPRDA